MNKDGQSWETTELYLKRDYWRAKAGLGVFGAVALEFVNNTASGVAVALAGASGAAALIYQIRAGISERRDQELIENGEQTS